MDENIKIYENPDGDEREEVPEEVETEDAVSESSDFDSISDFMVNGDYIEIRLPWQLLNFSDPSRMTVHDDYYENYGVDFIQIDKMYIGLGDKNSIGRIHMEPCELKGWGNTVTYHERLKKSYYMLQKVWRDNS